MSLEDEIAEVAVELVAEDPVTVTDVRSATFTARRPYGIRKSFDNEIGGHLIESEAQLLVPVANLPATKPTEHEPLTFSSTTWRIVEIIRGAGAWKIKLRYQNAS
jgi:hypothetical protein